MAGMRRASAWAGLALLTLGGLTLLPAASTGSTAPAGSTASTAPAAAAAPAAPAPPAAADPTVPAAATLRVGVLQASPPCAQQQGPGRWQGQAVDLWRDVASRERLPYLFVPFPTAQALLEASRAGRVEVGVGCLTITPERVGRYRFSLPFQESGVALLMQSRRFATGQALLRQLLRPQLLTLLAGYLLVIAALTVLVWWIEPPPESALAGPGTAASRRPLGRRQQLRRFAQLFQILATGPGTNTIVSSLRGQGLVVLCYLVRIVSASLIVSTLTLDVLQQPTLLDDVPRSFADLAGRRVAARPGSVSDQLLRTPPLAGRVRIVPLPSLEAALPLLNDDRVEAVLADEQQLDYLRQRAPRWQRTQLRLVLAGDRPESQAFVFSPRLEPTTAERIDRAISEVKREGLLP